MTIQEMQCSDWTILEYKCTNRTMKNVMTTSPVLVIILSKVPNNSALITLTQRERPKMLKAKNILLILTIAVSTNIPTIKPCYVEVKSLFNFN